MTISAILQGKGHEVVQLGRDSSVQDAITLLAERRIGCVPVVDGGEVIGIFSERDVVRSLGRSGPAILSEPVTSVMTSPAVTVTSDLPVMTALSMMTQRRIRHLPVVESHGLVGFISIGDLVKYRIDKIEAEAAALRDYIQSA
ncbi:CBS domain-containing protein [Sphingobium subterraneum]|uniref:CBS domain-containing protein n=1 Tax=Sphingobium subterraneum TaxID=627688 RepID=A0A841IZ52_9SPHN|nr:CBS domain-containing protein [Sphingobium subterraneum]MBB6123933.1 CBS domain-containing protein [Sphingobium subterraneum]